MGESVIERQQVRRPRAANYGVKTVSVASAGASADFSALANLLIVLVGRQGLEPWTR
jgi:hypothetical protein